MGEQALSVRVSVEKSNSEYIDGRRISLPVFSSDSGKEIPNYLRASIGSCHDYCKYGKETASIRQNRPWIKKTAPASEVVFPTVKSAKIARINASNIKPLEKGKSKIMVEDKISEDSESKLLKEKSLVKKTSAASGASKSEKLKRVLPTKVGSLVGGRKSLELQAVGEVKENKNNVNMGNRSSAVKKHDTATKSPKKLNAITRPPLSPSPSKLATKAKTPSSSTPPPVTPIAKSRSLASPNQLKTNGIGTHSTSSSATKKNKAVTLKAPPPLAPRNASTKKNLNFKDQNAKKGDASKTRLNKAVASRRGSIPYTSNSIATKLKRNGLQPEKSVDVIHAETKEFCEKKEEETSNAAEFRNQEGMESYDEVPEKTLYVIEMETGNIPKPASCDEDEVPAHSTITTQPEGGQCELRNTDKSPPSAEMEIPDTLSLTPSSTSSCTASSIQDDSTNTKSEVDYIIHEDDHLVDGENPKGAENAKLKKYAAIPFEDYSKDPVKLTFRRGTVIDITQENNAPRRLKFRRDQQVLYENTSRDEVLKQRTLKMTETTQDNATTKNNSGTVVLRHQDVQDKKDTKGLFNNVIEETASKLAETRKSKVKALVGAFETVISLQDGKPAATS